MTEWQSELEPVARETAGGPVSGLAHAHMGAVVDAFVDNFERRGELGASLCVQEHGRTVLDLWGGFADAERTTPWTRDTVCVVFSCTKAATAACVHLLHERGLLDLDAPVAEIWPAFGDRGRAAATPRMMLDHSLGLPALRDPVKADCIVDTGYMVDRLEQEPPFWEPGTRHGYHALTYGFLLGELVRRVSGRSLGQFFADEVATPFGLDFWIGLPEAVESRVSPIVPYRLTGEEPATPFMEAVRDPGTLPNLFIFNHGDWAARGINTRAGRAAEIGAAGGVSHARGLADLFTALAIGRPGDGRTLLQPETIAGLGVASSASHRDATLLAPTRFGPGFMVSMDNRRRREATDSVILGRNAFGHVGAGGSIGFADPDRGLAVGYAMNRQGHGLLLNERGQSLVDSIYRQYECTTSRSGFWA